MNKLKTHLPIILILLLFILLTCNLDTKTEYLELPNYIGDEKEIIDNNNYITSPMKDSIVKDKYSPGYFVDNEIIIYLKSGYNQHLFDNFLNIHELEIVGSLSEINLYQVRTKEHLTYKQLEHKIKEISKSGIVEFAGPNLITEINDNYTPNDSDLKDYWYTDIKNESKRTLYLEQIQADKAWDYKDQMETINVGIMDTIFCKHDDLKLNGTATIVEGESDKFYHGTSVAGAVGAKFNNGKGTCGVAPNVKLYAVENEHKNFDGYSSALKQIASLIELVHGYNCKVINASYGNDQRCIAIADGNKNKLKSLQLESSEIELAIKNLLDNHDFVICTSAGNLGIINDEECVKHVLKLKETENKTIDDLYEQVYTDKDIIIAADVSGSMKGEPLENMKYALTLLIGSLRNSGAEVSLLSFTDSVDAVIEKESDTDKLLEFISEMGVGGGTDLEIPLAYTEKIGSKILILFTDGENGKESKLGASRVGLRNLIYLANEMKRYGYKIYILGYPRNIDYRILLMYMATPGCYYEIEEPEELLRVFGYIKNDIFEHEYETLSVFCPVDVEIEYNGEKLDSKSNKESSFGYMMGSDKTGSKIFKLKKDLEYNIKITGNGYGYMTIVHTDENGEKIFGKVGVPVNRGDTLEFKLNDLEKTVYSIDELNLIQWVTRLSRIGIISSITFISLAGITIYILIHRKWKIAVIIGIFTIIAPISIISIGRIHHNLEHCGSVFETWFDIDVGLIEYDYAHLTDVSITLNYFEIKDVMETFIDGYNTQNMDKMLSIFSHAYRADSTRNKILNFGDKIYSYKIKDITKNKFDDFEYSYELVHDIIVESTSISEYEYIGFDKHDIVSVVKIEMDINGDEYAMYMLLENTGSIDLRQSHWRILEIKEGNSDGQSIIAHVMDSWTNFIYTMYKR